jgi:mono/diheme cytochrome c family protein
MKKLKLIGLASIAAFALYSCGGSKEESTTETATAETTEAPQSMVAETESYDPKRGEGKFTSENVTVGALDAAMATKGEGIANSKCISCHKLSDEKLVGPGWKGVSERRTPHWIMNFITNPDPMIDKDPEVQAQLELCLVRMPNQNLTDDDARSIVEYMRKNDGAQ